MTQLQELQLSFLTNVKSIDFVQNMPALQTLDLENVNFSSLEPLAEIYLSGNSVQNKSVVGAGVHVY
ncbi:leucine-rich repeat domain-containing protein [Paenibacillus sp. FSL R5-0517]|uniref:leucine-rich repeat domain-containing protein n=1 Tax=Paenibacillus sp. FSL R5-0517 TaxID=2921647 RepID=UPI0030DAC8B3